jgi:hypothetical protein
MLVPTVMSYDQLLSLFSLVWLVLIAMTHMMK